MAFKMKGSAFKLNNVATKSALKDMKWWNTNPKDRNDKSKEEAQAHNSKHTTGEDSEHAAPTKMKSPMKQEKYYEGEEFVNMTPAWAGTDELEKLKQKLKTLEEGSDEHHNLYNKIVTMREQWDQSQKALLEEERRNDMQTQAAAK